MEAVQLAKEGMELYNRVEEYEEAYEICGYGLREAYVGLKRLRHQVCSDSHVCPRAKSVLTGACHSGRCSMVGCVQDRSQPHGMENTSSQSAGRLCSHPTDSKEDIQLGEVESKLGPSVRCYSLLIAICRLVMHIQPHITGQ